MLLFLGLFSAERGGPCAVPRRHLEDLDGRDAIDFLQKEADVLVRRGRDVLADKISADGKLAVPSVNEDCKLHAGGAAEIAQRIERRADGAAGEQNIVDKHDGQSVDVEANVGRVNLGGKMRREIIAIEADVERAERYVGAFDLLDLTRKAMSEQIASGEDSHQGDVRGTMVGLENLVRDARERSLDFV